MLLPYTRAIRLHLHSMHRSNHIGTRRLTFLALMTALCVVGRFAFVSIPNVQPITAIVVWLTLTMGIFDGTVVSMLSMLITNLFMGMGYWTLAQLAAYFTVVLLVALLGQWHCSHPLLIHSIIAACMGFVYGFAVSLFQAPILGGFPAAFAYWLVGIPFDAMHAFGNIIIYPLLAPRLTKLIKRYPRFIDPHN
ncbi:ECF transporter S component [Liquorilactobacillus mali]